jgi:uncharacterized protein (DUF885 family)
MTSEQFIAIAADAIRTDCREHPDYATYLGEHSFDDELEDPTPAAAARERAGLTALIGKLDELDTDSLDAADLADREILRTSAERSLFLLSDLDEASWNPMAHNPGQALYALLSRDFAPLPDRLANLGARLRAIPDYFAGARERLDVQSAIHVEAAVGQLDGVVALIDDTIPQAVAQAGGTLDLSAACERARASVIEHQNWLKSQLPEATRPSRLGSQLFTRRLALALATPWEPKSLLEQAYRDLERVETELAELVARTNANHVASSHSIAAEFARLSKDVPTSDTILQSCQAALAETTDFVERQELLTLHHDPVEIIEMPEIDRGVAVAYCRGVGALETAGLQTQFAVSPTPRDWPPDRVASFYREYNNHMLHNLTVHEAMPGHVEQLSHSRRYQGATKVRSVYGSGSFIEGWAVYAEEVMAERGYRSDVSPAAALAVRMQQLKMQLRMILNTILDISFHVGDLDERGAMELMTVRGYQEDGEAAGKWRRVQLTSTQLCTYYVGYLEVRQLAADLSAAHPDWSIRQIHDTMLGLGSPPVRYLRSLLGLATTA